MCKLILSGSRAPQLLCTIEMHMHADILAAIVARDICRLLHKQMEQGLAYTLTASGHALKMTAAHLYDCRETHLELVRMAAALQPCLLPYAMKMAESAGAFLCSRIA